jgi:hypothetical protein
MSFRFFCDLPWTVWSEKGLAQNSSQIFAIDCPEARPTLFDPKQIEASVLMFGSGALKRTAFGWKLSPCTPHR